MSNPLATIACAAAPVYLNSLDRIMNFFAKIEVKMEKCDNNYVYVVNSDYKIEVLDAGGGNIWFIYAHNVKTDEFTMLYTEDDVMSFLYNANE